MRKKNVSLPRGVAQLSLREYLDERYRFEQLERIFKLWGYLSVVTPLVDFFSIYEKMLTPEEIRSTYRLLDREGELLLIRSDITLFLARQIGIQIPHVTLPLRLSYSGEILRHSSGGDFVNSDIHQSGIELIGAPALEGDIEILLLLFEALDALGGKNVVVHLGSWSFLSKCAQSFHIERNTFVSAIQKRDATQLAHILPKTMQKLLSVLFFIGTVDEFTACVDLVLPLLDDSLAHELDYLLRIGNIIAQTDFRARLRIDLSETAMRDYYSGIVFSAYDPDANATVSSGGRYDALLAHFSHPTPAAGFSIYPYKMCTQEILADNTIKTAKGNNILEKYRHAKKYREQGHITTL